MLPGNTTKANLLDEPDIEKLESIILMTNI